MPDRSLTWSMREDLRCLGNLFGFTDFIHFAASCGT